MLENPTTVNSYDKETISDTNRLEFTENTVDQLGRILRNSEIPLHQRFRALFTLRNLNGTRAIEAIGATFKTDDSALLKHELAYCLGQMQHVHALPILTEVLENIHEHPMVRHEAAEALGALGHEKSLLILQKYLNDDERVVRETCEIAIDRIHYEQQIRRDDLNGLPKDPAIPSFGSSVDPAPANLDNAKIPSSIIDLKSQLMNDSEFSLFDRYRAMFTLRNWNTDEACLALTEGFRDSSALFRHEIAFVLGQLQNPVALPALIRVLSDKQEHEMVRHECAEALGSIATEECLPILNEFKNDKDRVVRESCIVALDMYAYETDSTFHYTDSLRDLLSH